MASAQRPDNENKTVARAARTQAHARGAAAASAIGVSGDASEVWAMPSVLKQKLLFKAAAILAFASMISGILSILYARGVISVEVKDFLVGVFYFLSLAGALLLSGKPGAGRLALLAGSAIVFQAWNTVFFQTPQLAVAVLALGLWLPAYWALKDPVTMEGLGLGTGGLAVKSIVGLALSAAMTAYLIWGLKNFGFTFSIQSWRLAVNTAQVFPMYLAIFSLQFTVWNRLKAWGVSPAGLIAALAALAACLNLPAFAGVAAASGTPASTAISGFLAVTVVMVLSVHFTFNRFRSVIPAACLFTALAALLIVTGLV